jgi:flagellar hook assembly protein FlgD
MKLYFAFSSGSNTSIKRIDNFSLKNQQTREFENRPLISQHGLMFHQVRVSNSVEQENKVVKPFSRLSQNHPNPFNPSTQIDFYISHENRVELTIFNIRGQRIRDLHSGTLPAGRHSIQWDGNDNNNNEVSSGVYFYQLKTDSETHTRRMLLLK